MFLHRCNRDRGWRSGPIAVLSAGTPGASRSLLRPLLGLHPPLATRQSPKSPATRDHCIPLSAPEQRGQLSGFSPGLQRPERKPLRSPLIWGVGPPSSFPGICHPKPRAGRLARWAEAGLRARARSNQLCACSQEGVNSIPAPQSLTSRGERASSWSGPSEREKEGAESAAPLGAPAVAPHIVPGRPRRTRLRCLCALQRAVLPAAWDTPSPQSPPSGARSCRYPSEDGRTAMDACKLEPSGRV